MNTDLLFPGEERCIELPQREGAAQIQYQYRTERGSLFSCVCSNLEDAYSRCEDWMLRQERY